MITAALDIILQWPAFASGLRDESQFLGRIVLPNRVGKLRVVDGVFYTYARIPWIPTGIPTMREWGSETGQLWLMDFAYDRKVKARDAVEIANADGLRNGIVEPGERVYFYRLQTNRFGFGVAQDTDLVRERRVG